MTTMNIKSLLPVAAVVLAAMAAMAVDTPRSLTLAEMMSADGGAVVKPGSQKGKIVIADAQSRVPEKSIRDVIARIDPEKEYNIVYEKVIHCEDPVRLMKELRANFALVIVDDPKRPLSLVAPDDHWGLVNIAGIDAGLKSEKAKARFFEGRCRRQILRIFALAAGGGASQYQGNLTSPGKLSNLDFYDEAIPVDVRQRNENFLSTVGVTKKIQASYFTACQEGWAPAPSNELQKAIWDAIKAPPAKPMKITYDKAMQKPVVK